MAEQAGKNVLIKISGAPTTMTAEATTATGNISYQISNAVKQVLDRDTPPTVLDGGIATIEDYTVNYLNGTITFGTATARTITIAGKYLPMTVAAYAHESSNSRNVDVLDNTAYQSTHKSRIAGLKSASGTLSQFNISDATYSDALTAGNPVVIECRQESAGLPNRFWALLESTEVEAAIDGIQNETISWISKDSWLRLGA